MKKLTFLLFWTLMWVAAVPAWAAPTLTVHPERLVFECEAGRSFYRTFTVSGTDLTEDLTLTMFGDNLTFLMERTTITAEEAMAGVEVKVRYVPQAVGEYEARIWIESSEVKGTVLLLGTATGTPYIEASETVLNMTCPYNGMATATFTVTGDNLEEGIWLELNARDRVEFDIDMNNIPYYQTGDTTTVTVSYYPRNVGCDTATIEIWSRYSNDIVIKVYATSTAIEYPLICKADVYDVAVVGEDEYEITPAKPTQCGYLTHCEDREEEMVLNWRNGLMNIAVGRNYPRALMYFNTSQVINETTSGILKTITKTDYCIDGAMYLQDRQGGPYDIEGIALDDGSMSFDDFVVTSNRIVTVVNAFTGKVVSADTTRTIQLYRNMVMAKPNGMHRYSTPPVPDPGTAEPMAMVDPIVIDPAIDPDVIPQRQRFAPVYIEQRDDTVTVWNLYGMGGCNRIVLDNGFFDWAWQECGYNNDGGCWYNYTPYRSTTPNGEVMLNVVTYQHYLRGVKGKVTGESMTWGNTTFGTGDGVWSSDTYCDNVLSYTGENTFRCTATVWSISDVTRLIDGLLSDDPEVKTHPASDQNDDGEVNVTDVTSLIDRLLIKAE